MKVFDNRTISLASTVLTSLAILGCCTQGTLAAPTDKTISGKVVAVSEEKVTVSGKVLDQVTVSIEACGGNGALKTVKYRPATISDRTALGHLFDQNLQSARTANNPKQQQINGYGLFWLDAEDTVLRTGILGAGVDCGGASNLVGQFK